jgi:hypothetical protein
VLVEGGLTETRLAAIVTVAGQVHPHVASLKLLVWLGGRPWVLLL